jgi:hypothetical protein
MNGKSKTPFTRAQQIGFRFEKEWDDSLWYERVHSHPFWHFKMPDTHAWDGIRDFLRAVLKRELGNVVDSDRREFLISRVMKNKFITPKIPSDFYMVYDSVAVFMELKYFSKPYFDMEGTRITEHQDAFAMDIELEGNGYYYYVLCCGETNEVYIFDLISRYKAATYQRKMNYGSLKPEELRELSLLYIEKAPRGTHPKWNLTDFFEILDHRLSR